MIISDFQIRLNCFSHLNNHHNSQKISNSSWELDKLDMDHGWAKHRFQCPLPAMAEISGVVHGLTEFGRELLQRVVARKLQPGENVNESRCGCDEKKNGGKNGGKMLEKKSSFGK